MTQNNSYRQIITYSIVQYYNILQCGSEFSNRWFKFCYLHRKILSFYYTYYTNEILFQILNLYTWGDCKQKHNCINTVCFLYVYLVIDNFLPNLLLSAKYLHGLNVYYVIQLLFYLLCNIFSCTNLYSRSLMVD